MKIVLVGASGLLGSAFARAAHRRGHRVVGIVGRFAESVAGLSEQISLDLHRLEELEALVLERFPDAIVNCAAIPDIAPCEKDPASTRRLNVDLPKKLALLARHLFATLIHISTEQVFDGEAKRYDRDSAPNPLNEYARQKLESEQRVLELASEFATVLRLPLLNGNSLAGERSLHERLFATWAQGAAAPLFVDEVRQPCLADNAADAMVELCERHDLKGLYQWAGSEALSRYQIGLAVLAHFGLPSELAVPAERAGDSRFAGRPARLALDLAPLAGTLKTQPQPFAQQLDALIVPRPRRAWYNAL